MNLNLIPPEKPLEDSSTQYSTVWSIHPTRNSEDPGTQMEANQGSPENMPGWLAQLVVGDNNNPHRALEQFQKMKPLVFEGEADPLQAEECLFPIEKILDVMNCTEK